jgi:hypothetical protein
MAKAKVYLELSKNAEAFTGKKLFNVKRVVNTTRHLPGDELTEEDVKFLIRMSSAYEVIIDKAK